MCLDWYLLTDEFVECIIASFVLFKISVVFGTDKEGWIHPMIAKIYWLITAMVTPKETSNYLVVQYHTTNYELNVEILQLPTMEMNRLSCGNEEYIEQWQQRVSTPMVATSASTGDILEYMWP